MKQYPAYPAYKTTGCDWFPEIPSHWGIDRAKWSISSCQNGVWGAEPDGDDDLVCIRVADFDRQSLRVSTEKLTMRSIAEKDRRNRLLKTGDLLLEKSGGGEQQLVGAVVEFNQTFPAVTSNFIARMVASDGINSRFLTYLHSHLYSGRVNFRSIKQTTGIQNLDSQAYLDESITYPPLDEQQAIARFLDFKTAQIDALISKKKALLDKLAEKRTALISHAVTKGLDPSVPMKDSKVAWLGNIPAHWEAKRTKFTVSYIGSGKTPKGGSEVYVQEGIMILRSQNVHDKGLRLDDVAYITDEADSAQAASRVLAGDVLLNITGASIGRTSIVPTPFPQANVNQHVCILRPVRDLVTSEYLHLLLCSRQAKDQISSLENGTSREGLNFTQVGGLLFAFPPVQEQVAIVLTLASKVEAIDRQSEKVLSVIERLVEYRSSVITNAVTGKIDVRGFPIPQTAEGVAS